MSLTNVHIVTYMLGEGIARRYKLEHRRTFTYITHLIHMFMRCVSVSPEVVQY